jgi:hypothetical protein
MRRRARAIAIKRQDPFAQAVDSLRNFAMFAANLMYGTQARSRITFRVAIALAALGCALMAQDAGAVQGCLAV